jgi:hypothetical protein
MIIGGMAEWLTIDTIARMAIVLSMAIATAEKQEAMEAPALRAGMGESSSGVQIPHPPHWRSSGVRAAHE